jgi:hypothetical protein
MPRITILVNGEKAYDFTADRCALEQTRDGKFTMEAQGPALKQGIDFGVPGKTGEPVLLSEKITHQILPTQTR